MPLPVAILKPKREKSLLKGHPWVFSGAIRGIEGNPGPGETVIVRSSDGNFLAQAAYSPDSNIRLRVWSWKENETINRDFFVNQIKNAIQRRSAINYLSNQSNACRLIFAESDLLPGVIVDQYGRQLVMQVLSAGAESWRHTLAEILAEATGMQDIYERSDASVRELEGLTLRTGVISGTESTGLIKIQENGLSFLVDIRQGHKTGFYLDQRENRQFVHSVAKNADVLNCFAYSGGFSIAALAGGANSVTSIESSSEAITVGEQNLALNALEASGHIWIEGDVFHELRSFRDRGSSFDLIILDPPKFAATRKQVARAARGYKDINLLALKLLRPGGLLVTFSCSGGVDADLFQKIVAGAALDAGATAQIITRLSQTPDHPIALHFPESAYLKGLAVRKIS